MKALIMVLFVCFMGCGKDPAANVDVAAPAAVAAAQVPGLTVVKNLTCRKIDSTLGVSIYYQYRVLTYSTGDVSTTCSISDRVGEYSHSDFYRASQNGSTVGGCLVGDDLDTPTGGYWIFQLVGSAYQIQYKDPASTNNNYIYVFTAAECTTL